MVRLDRFVPMNEIAQIGAAIGREFGYELIETAARCRSRNLTRAQRCDPGLAFRRRRACSSVSTGGVCVSGIRTNLTAGSGKAPEQGNSLRRSPH